jgi:aminomethyltransferase
MLQRSSPAQRTPLNRLFRDMGVRLVEFAGWEMPVQFSSVVEEHRAVRAAAGLFDVSHMGELEISGPGALPLIQKVTCNDAARLVPGQAQYSVLTSERGTFIDDVLIYRRGANEFLLVVNAGNIDDDFAWIVSHGEGSVEVVNASGRWGLLAVQGPRAASILQDLTPLELSGIGYYRFAEGKVRDVPALVSRTGYTGEDGFEIYAPAAATEELFRAILEAGRDRGILPCGLGARDTLRIEARMLLYGNDMDQTTSVPEAGLGGIVRMNKGEFIGREALRRQEKEGLTRRLVGFEMVDRGIARPGHAVRVEGRDVGRVTSGTFAPHLKKSIGLAYVPAGMAAEGSRLSIAIRGREAAAIVVPTPFYKRPR